MATYKHWNIGWPHIDTRIISYFLYTCKDLGYTNLQKIQLNNGKEPF